MLIKMSILNVNSPHFCFYFVNSGWVRDDRFCSFVVKIFSRFLRLLVNDQMLQKRSSVTIDDRIQRRFYLFYRFKPVHLKRLQF